MTLEAPSLNSNPTFQDWKVQGPAVAAGNMEFCNGWLFSTQPNLPPPSSTVEPLSTIRKSGLRLRLRSAQLVRLTGSIDAGSAAARGRLNLVMRLRAVEQDGSVPRLDGIFVLQANKTSPGPALGSALQEIQISQEWSQLQTSIDFSMPSSHISWLAQAVSRLEWLRRKLANAVDQEYHPPRHRLAVALQFSQAGLVEIESCRVDDQPLKSTRLRTARLSHFDALEEVPSTPDFMLAPDVDTERSATTGIAPIAEGGIVALLEGRIVGWVKPEASGVRGSVQVDGESIGEIGGSELNGAEVALLGNHRAYGFSIPVPAGLLKGTVLRVSLRDEFSDRPVEGTKVRLMFQAGLHVPQPDSGN